MENMSMTLDRLIFLAHQGAVSELHKVQRAAFAAQREGRWDDASELFQRANSLYCDQQELFDLLYGKDYDDD